MAQKDLSEKVKKRARGTVKIAVAINPAGPDWCALGASHDNCGSLDLAADRADNETTILTTEDDPDSWAVVVDGENIIVKQTRKSNVTFNMQCWKGNRIHPETTNRMVTGVHLQPTMCLTIQS